MGLISVGILYPYRHRIIIKLRQYYRNKDARTESGICPGCAILFTDNVATHKKAYATGEGITPQKNDAGLIKLLKQNKLLELESNQHYIIRPMHHAKPYILPKGKKFINALVALYAQKCLQQGLAYIPFTITSVTRTIASVQKLQKSNGNAIKNSAHLKGKTFDVSYRAFNRNHQQNKLFILALQDLRKQKKCYVKYEKNGCLHITVN